MSTMEGSTTLPPGFRFHPTDEELITCYLIRKVSDFSFVATAIADVDLNKCEPWDLPGKASMGEKEWYFFSLRDRKYPTGLRTNRATDAGYWKTTGKDKEIFHSGVLVGMKKTLVFYKGRAPKGEKTNWVMHEYRLQTKFAFKPSKEEWVVCRVFRKSTNVKKPQLISQSLPQLMQSPSDHTNPVSEIGDIDISAFNNLVNSSSSFNAVSSINDTSNNNNFSNNHSNKIMDMSNYMNWVLTRDVTSQPSVSWPNSSILSSNFSPSPVLRGLQFNSSYQAREAATDSTDILNSLVSQGDSVFASSSKGIDSAQEREFDHEPIWQNY